MVGGSAGAGRAGRQAGDNPIIYAEISVAQSRIETLDGLLPTDVFAREPLPWPAGFLAGKAFLAYRRRGGEKRSPLPDFYIGADVAPDFYPA